MKGLDALVLKLDGTRYYTGSSNRIGLQDSGPYSWQDPAGYFTNLDAGFSVEDGTPSLATLEAIKAMIPPADRWPISDTLAYHDWHIGGNGDVRSFMRVLGAQLGEPTSLEDFERKAQMLNYVDYRAIFEGFNAHLWTRNSGRLLWMSHPAWPSNHWQMYSADYDTSAAYYGVKAALEPVHIQLNLPDYALAVINTSRSEATGLTLKAHVTDIAGKSLLEHQEFVTAPANRTTPLASLPIRPLIDEHRLVLVELTLSNADRVLSRNLYWQGKDDAAYRLLGHVAGSIVASERDEVGRWDRRRYRQQYIVSGPGGQTHARDIDRRAGPARVLRRQLPEPDAGRSPNDHDSHDEGHRSRTSTVRRSTARLERSPVVRDYRMTG